MKQTRCLRCFCDHKLAHDVLQATVLPEYNMWPLLLYFQSLPGRTSNLLYFWIETAHREGLVQLRLLVPLQLDGFGSDSVRLVRDLRRDAQQAVQFLLFSATFNERIKSYALRVTADDGKEEVNQVWPATKEHCCALSAPSVCIIRLLCIVNITMMHSMQVFVPREDLSLDVIKQYQVVSTNLTSECATAPQDSPAYCVLI